MAGLTDGKVLADVGRGDETERANKRSSAVRKNVAVQVGGDNDVVVLGLAEELVHHRVDNLLLDVDELVLGLGEGATGRLAEEAVGLREDVGLVSHCDERARVDRRRTGVTHALAAEGNVAGHGGDVVRGSLGDALDGLCDLAAVGGGIRLLLLDVQVLGVLADNDEVDGPLCAGDRLDRAHVGVQLQALAERDNGRRVALCGYRGRRDGTEEGAIAVRLEGRDRVLGQRNALLLERVPAGLVVREAELEAKRRRERLEDAAAGGDDFAANAVTGDEA